MSEQSERCHKRGPFEIRLHDDGAIDEILLYVGGECVVHLEQMDDGYFWMGLYAENKTCHVNVGARKGDAFINASWWNDEDTGDAHDCQDFGFEGTPMSEQSERLSLREALDAVVATYNGTLSGDLSPHALASAIVDAEAALAAPDEAVAMLKRCRKLLASHGAMKTAHDIDAFLKRQEQT